MGLLGAPRMQIFPLSYPRCSAPCGSSINDPERRAGLAPLVLAHSHHQLMWFSASIGFCDQIADPLYHYRSHR